MEKKKIKGHWGWLGLGAYVLAYDVWAIRKDHETLSSACWRGLSTPRVRWIVGAMMFITGKHLAAPSVLPKTDPFGWLADGLRKKDIV